MHDKMVAISLFIILFPDTIAGKWRGVILRFSASKTSRLNSTPSCTKKDPRLPAQKRNKK